MKLVSAGGILEFNDLYLALHKRFRDAAYEDAIKKGFTVPQIMVIYELHQEPEMTLQELANRLGLAKSTTSSLVERMVARGIVARAVPGGNRRTVMLSLTAEFTSQNEELLSARDHLISDIFHFHTVSSQDADGIIRALNMLLALIDSDRQDS